MKRRRNETARVSSTGRRVGVGGGGWGRYMGISDGIVGVGMFMMMSSSGSGWDTNALDGTKSLYVSWLGSQTSEGRKAIGPIHL